MLGICFLVPIKSLTHAYERVHRSYPASLWPSQVSAVATRRRKRALRSCSDCTERTEIKSEPSHAEDLWRNIASPPSLRLNAVASMYRISLCVRRNASAECAFCAGKVVGVSGSCETSGEGCWTPCTRTWCCSACCCGRALCPGERVREEKPLSHTVRAGQCRMRERTLCA